MIRAIVFVVLAFTAVEGEDDQMPSFEDKPCSLFDWCIEVTFPNGVVDMLLLTRDSPTSSIYEGSLEGDEEVGVVLIDTPSTGKRLINFNSDNVEHCSNFDIDVKTNSVKCLRAGSTPSDKFNATTLNREITAANTNGPIVPLGSHYGTNGIPVKVLFTFDTKFYKEFNGKDGKSGADYMDQVIALVRNAYRDKSLKTYIGTTVEIVGTKKVHTGAFTGGSGVQASFPIKLEKLAKSGGDYDLFTYISHPGAAGVAIGGVVCNENKGERISFNSAYGPHDCDLYNPPQKIDCTITNRIMLTAETIAHEIGHNLGMDHDFKQKVKDSTGKYEYRNYEKETKKCRGLMDYIDDGVGWSKCSARDFSRYLTSGGSKTACLKKSTKAPATAKPTPQAPVKTATKAPTTVKPATKAPATCRDLKTKKECEAGVKDCYQGDKQSYMEKNCAKTCYYCMDNSGPQ